MVVAQRQPLRLTQPVVESHERHVLRARHRPRRAGVAQSRGARQRRGVRYIGQFEDDGIVVALTKAVVRGKEHTAVDGERAAKGGAELVGVKRTVRSPELLVYRRGTTQGRITVAFEQLAGEEVGAGACDQSGKRRTRMSELR